MNIIRWSALLSVVAVASSCTLFGPQPQAAPAWLAGHYQGHNVRAPSYPVELTVDNTGRVTLVNATHTVYGQYVSGDRVVWNNGKSPSLVSQAENGVVFTQTDDSSNVDVFER